MLRITKEALTFDDVLLVPGHSTVLPHTVDLKTRLTRGVTLNMPLISAAMDTVTEARLAIALAQEGGIGFIHKNMTPESQAAHVLQVKKYESGVVSDPVTVSKDATIGNVKAMSKQLGYSGFPVVDEENNLIGLVTGRDLRFENRLDQPISKVMTPKEKLVTVKEDTNPDVVMDLPTWYPFYECMESSPYNQNRSGDYNTTVAIGCAQELDWVWLDWNLLEGCAGGEEGNELMHKVAQATPEHDYVPWVVVDGVTVPDSGEGYPAGNLVEIVCEAYTGDKPDACL